MEPGPAYHEMTSFAALEAAFRKARRGKRGTPEESAFFLDLEPELLQLERDLRTFTYEPRPYQYFQIRDPKPRTISVAAFRDRVVHHALVAAMEPAFEAGFWRHSYACRKGKGTHRALAWTRHYARRFPYFLKLDVRKFFDHVSHPVLLQEIARRVDDPGILWLCATILSHAHVPGAPAATGIPIGNLTSQFWGNVALDPLDRLLAATSPGRIHVRYMDDVICFGHSKDQLWRTHDEVRGFLRDRLHLELKDEATVLAPVTEGIPFLGFRVFPGTVRLQHPGKVRYTRRVRATLRAWGAGAVSEEKLTASLASLSGFVESGDTLCFRRAFLGRLEDDGWLG